MTKPKLIVALDVENFEQAKKLIDTLEGSVDIFKIGSQLFTAYGPFITRYLQAKGKKVFLDLKFHDIPNTVASAVKAAVSLSVPPNNERNFTPLYMLTVHTSGGQEMLIAAVKAAKEQAKKLKVKAPLIVGVTVLTSQAKEDKLQALVLERALLAKRTGLNGVVASVEEAPLIKRYCPKNFLVITPGIRPLGTDAQDQKRVATPRGAIECGSNYLVVGRPILQAEDPLKAAKAILKEISKSAYLGN
jgi:orotidine-5'-phosphate decarboxylase